MDLFEFLISVWVLTPVLMLVLGIFGGFGG